MSKFIAGETDILYNTDHIKGIINYMRTSGRLVALVFFSLFLLTSCGLQQTGRFRLIDAKIATAVDENLAPLQVSDNFPKSQSSLSCWIKWQDAETNTQLLTKWHYVTDDVHISDHIFVIPKKDGVGSVEISMPEGKTFPQGQYRVDIVLGKRILKRLTFSIS